MHLWHHWSLRSRLKGWPTSHQSSHMYMSLNRLKVYAEMHAQVSLEPKEYAGQVVGWSRAFHAGGSAR